mmetsp:Transcript_63790/g.149540  ORF Transcript_63790/g.149540 Transcript_63790/m.149540 type:complete len:211 (-) Transcript_63790:188-820(-)
MVAQSQEDDVATAALLLNSAGIQKNLFPKTYHIKLSKGFVAYLIFLTVFVFAYTLVIYYAPQSDSEQRGVAFEHLLFFDVAYCGAILFFILMQVPRRVVRDNDSLKIVFCCRTRLAPIESLVEIRIVRRRRCCDKQGRLCIYPGKCFWGYPTSFDQNVIVVTDSCCNNYFFCLHDMEEFVLDNWPALEEEGEADEPVKVQVEPAMIGSKC